MNTTTPGLNGLIESTEADSSAPAGTNPGSDGLSQHREVLQQNIDSILRGNMYGTMSQKVVMDRNYYNLFYKYKDSNAKLLKIRQQTRFNNASAGPQGLLKGVNVVPTGSHTQNSKFLYQYRTLSKDSSKGSRAAHL